MRPPLKHAAFWALVGSGGLNLCRFAAVAVLARIAPPEVVGLYLYSLALTGPVFLLGQFELRTVLVADPHSAPDLREYRRARNIGLLGALALLAALVAWEAPRGPTVLALLVATGLGRLAWNLSELTWGIWQRGGAWPALAQASVLRGLCMLLPIAGLALLEPGAVDTRALAMASFAVALAWMLAHALSEGRGLRRAVESQSSDAPRAIAGVRRAPELLRLGLPLALVQVLIVLCDSVPRFFLAGQGASGMRDLGHFGALAQLALLANLALVAISTAASRRLTEHYHGDRRAFRRLAGRLLLLAMLLAGAVLVAAWVLTRTLLPLLFPAEYSAHHEAFMRLILAHCLLLPTSVLGFIITSAGRFWVQLPLHVLVLATTIVACAWWVPADPVNGAAQAALARAAVHLGLYTICAAGTLLTRPAESPPHGANAGG